MARPYCPTPYLSVYVSSACKHTLPLIWHCRPCAETIRRNRQLVQQAVGGRPPAGDQSEDATARRRQWELADVLLGLDTGSWGNNHITHHCNLYCCPGGVRESRMKIWSAIAAPWIQQPTTIRSHARLQSTMHSFTRDSELYIFKIFTYLCDT